MKEQHIKTKETLNSSCDGEIFAGDTSSLSNNIVAFFSPQAALISVIAAYNFISCEQMVP